jgi:hypothetical protein
VCALESVKNLPSTFVQEHGSVLGKDLRPEERGWKSEKSGSSTTLCVQIVGSQSGGRCAF